MNELADGRERIADWFARLAVGFVFALNVSCAFAFIFQPDLYSSGFELTGLPGRVMVQALGIAFLMWNVTYPPVVFRPQSQQTLFAVILIQQVIGLSGETCLWLNLPNEHPALAMTGLRFIIFDGLGLVLMGIAFAWLRYETQSSRLPHTPSQPADSTARL
jgi:hypothetical protein